MKIFLIAVLAGLTLTATARASTSSSSDFTQLRIAGPEAGELVLSNAQSNYRPWDSASLIGKARVVLHMAGTTQARAQLDPLIEALKAKKLDAGFYQTTTVVDLSDAIWGTRMLVLRKVTKNKATFPWSSFVVDHEGRFRQAMGLQHDSAAFYVLNSQGQVMHFREGKPTQTDIDMTLHLLDKEILRLKTLTTTTQGPASEPQTVSGS